MPHCTALAKVRLFFAQTEALRALSRLFHASAKWEALDLVLLFLLFKLFMGLVQSNRDVRLGRELRGAATNGLGLRGAEKAGKSGVGGVGGGGAGRD